MLASRLSATKWCSSAIIRSIEYFACTRRLNSLPSVSKRCTLILWAEYSSSSCFSSSSSSSESGLNESYVSHRPNTYLLLQQMFVKFLQSALRKCSNDELYRLNLNESDTLNLNETQWHTTNWLGPHWATFSCLSWPQFRFSEPMSRPRGSKQHICVTSFKYWLLTVTMRWPCSSRKTKSLLTRMSIGVRSVLVMSSVLNGSLVVANTNSPKDASSKTGNAWNDASLSLNMADLSSFLRSLSSCASLLASSKRSVKSSSWLEWTRWRNACCSAMNALIRMLSSSTSFLVDSLTGHQLDKHSHWYVSISVINLLDALRMFSIAFSRAMSTFLRKDSQCARIFNSDSMDILVSLAAESPICARRDLNLPTELEN